MSPTDAFDEYQRQEAWTWEHQALVRARMIYGDAPLQQAFANTRHQILCLPERSTSLNKRWSRCGSKCEIISAVKKRGALCSSKMKAGSPILNF
ncbi:hypothetical protein [Vibrio cholerae]|uniref:hypothetical protein n=1 Tax=Vibrio cholerae TaxID=666 RepID=UPI0022B25318|nr:hypothetical protein [Vibrio cholerae]